MNPTFQKILDRIQYLSELPDGWYDGDGLAPNDEVLQNVKKHLNHLLTKYESCPRPGLFPTTDGGVTAEWSSGDNITDVDFTTSGAIIVAWTNKTSMTHEDRELDANDLEAFSSLIISLL